MKKASFLLTMIVLLIAVSSQLIALDVTPREVIIKTHEPLSLRGNRTGITELDGYLQSKSVRSINRVSIPGMNYYVAHLGVEITREDLSDLEFDGVEYIQTNNLNQLYKIPNDTYYYSQELSTIALPEAWDFETGNENITVAVVDSGLLRAHPDLQGRCRLNFGEDADGDGYVMDPVTGVYDPDDLNGIDDDGNGFIDDICGWDFSDAPELEEIALGDYFDQDNDTNDENFHGTHVSGIICANSNNGIGVTGINWESKILPVRAGFRTLEGTGYLQDDDAAAAIIYAVNAGANVINLSWGDDEYSPIIADACEFAYERGAIVVASAGNTPGPLLSYPARLANVISVGSVGRDNDLSSFSSYGPDLDLVAPGEIIKSTYSDGVNYTYGDQSGTSMAAPHVAGCISLLLSRYPNMSFEDVRSKLLASCDDLGSAGRDDYYGSGKLNAFNLIYDESVPDVKLVSPVDNAGYSQGFPIIGTVSSDDFLYYTLMYSFEPVPNQLDWKDIVTHNNRPTEFTTQVYNDVINDFPFLAELPDGNYRLRLEIFDTNYRSYRVIRSFRLDRTAPILNADTVFLYPRYDAENMNYFLQALYNEKVVLNVECENPQGTVYSSTSAYPNELQTVKLPENLPEDLYNFTITATNICGQSSVAHYFEAIVYQSASINGWDRRDVGDGIVAIPKAYDFNGNGKPEVVGMHLIANSYDDVFIYEIGDSLEVTHSFDSAFWPYDIGNTDEDGLDFIGLNLDTIYQYESHGDNDYPITSPSYTESGTAGAYYRDIDLDGVDELMVLRNAATERIWDVKKKNAEGTGYDTYTELRNTSPTNQRNSFVPSIEVGRLDDDYRVDILTADTEGDIMIYETSTSSPSTDPVWSFKFAVQNTYYLKTGDFTGDGITDFIVVGYND
ncbi:MAG: S8 family serine peptidase, partial [Candidatus Zophobacter franzmannii]|nr:S8 family serine peptidase [Candidatus Zophobacter franzmannii]